MAGATIGPEEGNGGSSSPKNKAKGPENGDDGLAELESDEGPFLTDKYIMPDKWSGIGKAYIVGVAIPAREVALSDTFNGIILVAIIIAGLLVGIQTYPGMETDTVIVTIDNIILVTFCVEILLKMAAEGLAPWRFFTSKEWRWNNFDFIIVMLCMPFVDLGNSIALLRLFRLMRLAKLVRKVPQLQMIIMGLVGGLSSIGYILLLLFLVFYLFAIAGIYAFRENDPFHYGDLWTALLTLFRASTLEDWTDLMYINMFGCDTYLNVYITDDARQPDNRAYWCTFPMEKNVLTQLYFVFFIVVSALVMLSLFVGAVTMSMTESMEEMKKEDEEKQKAKMKAKQLKKLTENSIRALPSDNTSTGNLGGGSSTLMQEVSTVSDEEALSASRQGRNSLINTNRISIMVGLGDQQGERAAEQNRMQKLMLGAWEGVDLASLMKQELKTYKNPVRNGYYQLAEKCKTVVEDSRFVNFITLVIVAAGAIVGLQTYPGYAEDEVTLKCETDECVLVGNIDFVILLIFTLEISLKFLAADNAPLRVLQDAWNAFDFLIVLGSWTLGGGMITMLRLLRLLRVLKLVKAFPQLQVIVSALMMGMASIGYIGVILVLVFYVFAIIGIILFKDNDPWHFGTLHVAMLSLFRASTFEDWTDIMYINMYGCDQYGYSSWPEQCTQPKALGVWSAIFFVIFVIIGGLVLLTLFIGVVSTSMDEAQAAQREEKEMEEKVKDLVEERNIDNKEIELYKQIFGMLDLDGGGTIEEEELRVGLQSIGKKPTDEELSAMLKQVDEDESGEIDLAEFIGFMLNLKDGRENTGDSVKEAARRDWEKKYGNSNLEVAMVGSVSAVKVNPSG